MRGVHRKLAWAITAAALLFFALPAVSAERFEGRFFCGEGDVEYLQLLDIARRMFTADPEFQNVPMLYTPVWNGLVEGPTWGAWWIQNSYGPTYCAMPFYSEPLFTFLMNAHDLWFSQMGDGHRKGAKDWVAPDGCLCDAAAPNWIMYKQGDGRIDIHDWGMEFTAAGLLMQAELLLIQRDPDVIAHYLPMLERCAAFIESRRNPNNNLFLAGPAGNLLAPSYAGWKRPDGSYDKAYLSGLSITYIAALDRLIEVEKMAERTVQAETYAAQCAAARAGLPQLTTEEGYFIKSLDPDGTRHGVYGAKQFGYFEASPNHDAIAFRVVDDNQAGKIYAKIAAIPLLRRYDFILPNEPGLDDMYEPDTSWLWKHGTWVNGGHWSTCEARMVMAYYRLGKFEDARRSMKRLLTFARDFRMDNPLVEFGSKVYQPDQPINLCYDSFGPAAALVRGLFEYRYGAENLVLLPHIPSSITQMEQRFPIRFGTKRLYLAATGQGPITSVQINGGAWDRFDAVSVTLPYADLPEQAYVRLGMGGAPTDGKNTSVPDEYDWNAIKTAWNPDRIRSLASQNRLALRFGADSRDGSNFIGELGRVRVYDQALNETAIAALARHETPPDSAPKPLGDWPLAFGEDRLVPNSIGAEFPAKAKGERDEVDTPHGKAAVLDGKGWFEVANDPRLELNGPFSLTAWINSRLPAEKGARIIDKISVGRDDGYLLDLLPGNTLRVISRQGTVSCPNAVTPGAWTLVSATRDATGLLRLYVNDHCVAETRCAATPQMASALRLPKFVEKLQSAGWGQSYEAQHALLVMQYLVTIDQRQSLLEQGTIPRLPDTRQTAADRSYEDTAMKLLQGLESVMDSYANTQVPQKKQFFEWWREAQQAS